MSESPEQNSADRLIGATLHDLRVSRGIELEEVARVTRIGKGYLAAIEEGRLDKLPSGAYSRGFLRQYAQFLGLGEAEIAALLSPAPPGSGEEEPPPKQGKRPARREPRRVKVKGNWLISALLLALVALIALVTGDRRPDAPVSSPPAVDRSPPVSQPAAVNPSQLAVTSSRREPPPPPATPSDGARPAAAPRGGEPPSDGVVLRLKVIQDSWLTVTIDDALSQRYELKSGDVIEWKGERSFMLDVGNGAAFEGEFNGKPIQPLGEAGKPAHVVLKAGAPGEQ